MYTDVMIDLETLDTQPTAAVFEIGAVPFSLSTGRYCRKMFHRWRVDVVSCLAHGATICQETIDWWHQQGWGSPSRSVPISVALQDVHHLITALCVDDPRMWCKGPAFDAAILDFHFRACKLSPPWKYHHVRDVRTVVDLACRLGHTPADFGHATHRADYDCILQIKQVCDAMRFMTGLGVREGGEA